MLISHRSKFIFIHIYKTAGTSITKALRPFADNAWKLRVAALIKRLGIRLGAQPYPDHISAADLIAEIGRERFDSYFSFAFVRNPWDWQASFYTFVRKTRHHAHYNLLKSLGSFDNYIRWRSKQYVGFQKDFIFSAQGEQLVDYVGRYERVEEDFKYICDRLGIVAGLPRLNVSRSMPYQDYYNEETKELVRQTFAADIALFNYSFD